jgi:hypothetical protein
VARVFGRVLFIFVAALAIPFCAYAGMPRGAMISADEQDADAETGVTVAHGNAEISVEKSRILGRADSIEINPGKNQILFRGRAIVTVGAERFESDAVTCSLDFNKCAPFIAQSVSAMPVASPPPQALPPPAGLGSAVTSPR